jgi:hypothetical protein
MLFQRLNVFMFYQLRMAKIGIRRGLANAKRGLEPSDWGNLSIPA